MASHRAEALTWSAAAADLWDRLGGPECADVTRTGTSTGLSSPLPVDALAMGAVSVAGRAAAVLTGADPRAVVVEAERVGSSFRADQLMRIAGAAPPRFAPLSGFFRAADGWVRTHANYPHHRSRLLAALDCDDNGVTRAIAQRPAHEVEDVVTATGGVAVALRERATWRAEPTGQAVGNEPLIDVRNTGIPAAPPRTHPRVLDLTRVIAGPVATRMLALVGADVLRVDPPGLPELAAQHTDTGIGKRTTTLDVESPAFATLLAEADVLVLGYRSGALPSLEPEILLRTRPDLTIVRLNAWGWTGPWASRRGFDSIVQAAVGIAVDHQDGAGNPGALPAQALDHATGYLAAASALLGLATRAEHGGGVRDLALARTAHWLADRPGGWPVTPAAPVRQQLGGLDVEVPPPALTMPGCPDRWQTPAHPLGTDQPTWRQPMPPRQHRARR